MPNQNNSMRERGAVKVNWIVVVGAVVLVAALGVVQFRARQSENSGPATAATGRAAPSVLPEKKLNVVIRADMTLQEVSQQSEIPVKILAEALKIPVEGASGAKLKDLMALYGLKLEDVQKTVVEKKGDCLETCKVE